MEIINIGKGIDVITNTKEYYKDKYIKEFFENLNSQQAVFNVRMKRFNKKRNKQNNTLTNKINKIVCSVCGLRI